MFSSRLPVALLTSGSRTSGVTGGAATATQTHNASGAKQLLCPGASEKSTNRKMENCDNMMAEFEIELVVGIKY